MLRLLFTILKNSLGSVDSAFIKKQQNKEHKQDAALLIGVNLLPYSEILAGKMK